VHFVQMGCCREVRFYPLREMRENDSGAEMSSWTLDDIMSFRGKAPSVC